MKRAFFIILALALTGAAFATGVDEETTGVAEITMLANVAEDDPMLTYARERLAVTHPETTVTILGLDLSDGSTMTIDALLAAGLPPNIYDDYIGRISKYLVPEYAYPLNDWSDGFVAGVLDAYTRDGQILGQPKPGGAQGVAINLDIMEEIGYTVEPGWTIADFLEMAGLVKQRYGGQKWATSLFAGNQSGNYLMENWFAAFGADHFQNGDYSHTTIAETGGAATYEFWQTLVENEYVPPGAATQVDDDYVLYFARGELAAAPFFPGWVDPYFNVVAQQGYEPFDYMFVEFPRGPGVGPVPTYVSGAAVVVANTGTAADEVAAEFLSYWNSDITQTMLSATLVIPNRVGATFLPKNDRVAETQVLVANNGIMDVGLTSPFYAAIRPTGFPIMQKVVNLQITPDEAIQAWAADMDEILAD